MSEKPHPTDLRYVEGGYGPELDEVNVILLRCTNCDDWTAWTTQENFNRQRGKELAFVTPDGILCVDGAWICPECNRKNHHDFAHAMGWAPNGDGSV